MVRCGLDTGTRHFGKFGTTTNNTPGTGIETINTKLDEHTVENYQVCIEPFGRSWAKSCSRLA